MISRFFASVLSAAAILRHTFGLLDPPISRLFPLLELTRFIDYYPRVIRLLPLLLSGIKIGNWLAKVASMPSPRRKKLVGQHCSYFHGSLSSFQLFAIDFVPIKALEIASHFMTLFFSLRINFDTNHYSSKTLSFLRAKLAPAGSTLLVRCY